MYVCSKNCKYLDRLFGYTCTVCSFSYACARHYIRSATETHVKHTKVCGKDSENRATTYRCKQIYNTYTSRYVKNMFKNQNYSYIVLQNRWKLTSQSRVGICKGYPRILVRVIQCMSCTGQHIVNQHATGCNSGWDTELSSIFSGVRYVERVRGMYRGNT